MADDPVPIQFGKWTPDQPDFNNDGCTVSTNVFSLTQKSKGPVPGLMTYSSALAKICQGAAAYLDSGGTPYLFAGDANDLYLLDSASAGVFNAISKSAGAYAVPSLGRWVFEYFQGSALATNGFDPIQTFLMGTDTAFSDLTGSPPVALYMAAIKNFIMLGFTTEGSTVFPQRLHWSGFGDATAWPTAGSATAIQKQSSFNDLLNGYGFIQNLTGAVGNADGLCFQDHAIQRISFIGASSTAPTWDFSPVSGAKGTPASYSVVVVGAMAFYLGEDGYYSTDGVNIDPIGALQVDNWFWSVVDQSNLAKINVMADPIRKNVLWAFPDVNGNGTCNNILVYNWILRDFNLIKLNTEALCKMLSIGYTLDQLYTVLGYTLDTLPAPLDSRVWSGGQLYQAGVFGTDHKLAYFSGANLPATLTTKEYEVFPGRRSLNRGIRPIVDAAGSGVKPTTRIGYRDTQEAAVSFTASRTVNSLGLNTDRVSSRYQRIELTIPSGTWKNTMGVEVDATKRKGRR